MADETPDTKNINESAFFGISVRAWLAVMAMFFFGAICILSAVQDFVKQDPVTVPESLTMITLTCVSFYLGGKVAAKPS